MNSCGCSRPILDIDEMPDSVATLRYNINGLQTWYDYGNMIYQAQTDTSISADALNRVLTYMAERHTDSISAKELGAILHLADLGDVDITNLDNNSLLVYRKDANCSQGCEGISNSWTAWNAGDNGSASMSTVMGFDDKDNALSMMKPANKSKHYMLGWHADKKVSYAAPNKLSDKTSITFTEGGVSYYWKLCMDPNTFEIVAVKERA